MLTPQDMEKMLRQSLADYKLSGPEKCALGDVLAEAHLDGQKTAAFRAIAFKLAREEIEIRPTGVLGWLEDVVKLLHPVRQGSAVSVTEVLFSPFDDLSSRIVQLLRAAKKSIDLCVFTITDDRISDAVIAAHKKGVRVRVISDDMKSEDLGADIERFQKAGIAVRLDKSQAHMHHKFAIFDETILVNGSYNWTRAAAADNNENLVLTGERMLVDTFLKHFEKLWAMLA